MKRKSLSRLLAGFLSLILIVPSVQGMEVSAETAESNTYEMLTDVIESKKVSLENYGEDELVEFIVELEEQPLAETKAQKQSVSAYLETAEGAESLAAIEKEQKAVEKQIRKIRGAGMEIEYSYKMLLNGFAVSAPYSEKETLESILGVKNVYIAQTYEYVEPVNGYTAVTYTSGEMMDSDRVNAEGYTGKGTVTAVLDTGLDITHEGFANAPEDPRYTKAMIESALKSETGLNADVSAETLYKSAKIPFAYDYADQDADVADSQGHGTHVSGTVGADTQTFTGVAPDTQIMAMKVFSDTSSGASDTWIIAALEDCVTLGVDTINMSLGSSAGFSQETDEVVNAVYERVEAEGISLMCAAGNDTSSAYMNATGTDMNEVSNPDTGLVSSPSSYDAALSVASINEMSVYSQYFKAGDHKITFVDASSEERLNFINALNGKTLEYVVVGGCGEASDFAAVDVKGKVALVARGTITFTEKEQNAKNAGAVALICYNNVDGEAVNMQSGGLMPMVSITKADGELMCGLETKTITVSKDFAENMPSAESGQMSDFSNLGVTPDMKLKPEITAPGGNVYSTTVGNTYGNMSGTSMASPHMAGAASVVRQYVNERFSDLSTKAKQELINNLLMSTAVPVKDLDSVYYTPRKQGAGLAEVYNAVHTDAYLTVKGDRPKAELGDNENGTFSFSFEIHNIGTKELTYRLSAVPLTAKVEEIEGTKYVSESSRVLPENEFGVTFSKEKVTVPAGKTAEITVEMQLTEEGKKNLTDFVNGTFLDGFIMLETEDGVDLSLPYLGFYGDWAKAPIYDTTIYDEKSPVTYTEAGMYQMNLTDGTVYPLGVNLLAEDYEGALKDADLDKIAVANYQYASCATFPLLGTLRSSALTTYQVKNPEGTVIFEESVENARKSYYSTSYSTFLCDMPMNGWVPITEDGKGGYQYLPDGVYTYTITAEVAGKENSEQTISFPITLDNQAPELVAYRYYEFENTPYLEVTVKDNHYLMGIQLCDETATVALSEACAVENEAEGEEAVYAFDLTGALQGNVKNASLCMIDYAYNVVYSPVFPLVSQQVTGVVIEQQDINCKTDAAPFRLTAKVTPENAADQRIFWSSEDETVAQVDKDGWVTVKGAGSTVIRASASNGVYAETTIVVEEKAVEPETPIVPVEPDGKDPVVDIFSDVVKGAWYVDAVQYVYDNELMTGYEGTFTPLANMSRAMVVTTLYRMENSPEVTDYSKYDTFTDVSDDAWYKDAVTWALNNEIATGDPVNHKFDPNANVTREQLAAFLYRYTEFKDGSTEALGDLSSMKNADKVSTWALEEMKWAVGKKLISGLAEVDAEGEITGYDLAPQGFATRAQMATILMRYCENNN